MATVNIEEFGSNSLKEKEQKKPPEKKVEKVVTGTVKKRKKSFGSKLKETFVKEDRGDVKEYLIFDIIIPTIRDTIVDGVCNTMHMIFYGDTKRRDRGRVANTSTRVSYASYYKDSDDRRSRASVRESRNDANDDDILFETRAEAQNVLDSLADIIDEYGSASIADFYDLCGVTENYTDHKYGWTDVSKATISSVRGGYFVLNLPRARQIG